MPSPRRQHPCYRFHCLLQKLSSWSISEWLIVWLGRLVSVNLSLVAAFLVLLKLSDPQDQALGPLMALADWLYRHRFTVAWWLLLVQLFLQSIRWTLRRLTRSIHVPKAEQVLNILVNRIFEDQDLAEHVYRATLFQVKNFVFFGYWLGAVARSGHVYRRLATVLSISPERKVENTGFAGECWRQKGQTIMSLRPLPDQRKDGLSQAEQDQYKTEGYLADDEYNRMAVKSCVFLATGIKVNGLIWGILVLDSTDPQALPTSRTTSGQETADAEKRRRTLEFAAESLSLLVK